MSEVPNQVVNNIEGGSGQGGEYTQSGGHIQGNENGQATQGNEYA